MTRRLLRHIALTAVGLFLVLALPSCSGEASDPSRQRPASGLTRTRGIDSMKQLFNRHAGVPRLLLFLSPT